MEEKDKSLESLLTHVHSLQDEVQQLSGLYHQQGSEKPIVSDLVRERERESVCVCVRKRERERERDG